MVGMNLIKKCRLIVNKQIKDREGIDHAKFFNNQNTY